MKKWLPLVAAVLIAAPLFIGLYAASQNRGHGIREVASTVWVVRYENPGVEVVFLPSPLFAVVTACSIGMGLVLLLVCDKGVEA